MRSTTSNPNLSLSVYNLFLPVQGIEPSSTSGWVEEEVREVKVAARNGKSKIQPKEVGGNKSGIQ